jgi:hypothetical protein
MPSNHPLPCRTSGTAADIEGNASFVFMATGIRLPFFGGREGPAACK